MIKCCLCGKPTNEKKYKFVVEHTETKAMKIGFLCSKCYYKIIYS